MVIGLIGCRIRTLSPEVQDQCPEATAEIFYWYSVCGMIAMIAARPNSGTGPWKLVKKKHIPLHSNSPCSPRCTLTMKSSVEPHRATIQIKP